MPTTDRGDGTRNHVSIIQHAAAGHCSMPNPRHSPVLLPDNETILLVTGVPRRNTGAAPPKPVTETFECFQKFRECFSVHNYTKISKMIIIVIICDTYVCSYLDRPITISGLKAILLISTRAFFSKSMRFPLVKDRLLVYRLLVYN